MIMEGYLATLHRTWLIFGCTLLILLAATQQTSSDRSAVNDDDQIKNDIQSTAPPYRSTEQHYNINLNQNGASNASTLQSSFTTNLKETKVKPTKRPNNDQTASSYNATISILQISESIKNTTALYDDHKARDLQQKYEISKAPTVLKNLTSSEKVTKENVSPDDTRPILSSSTMVPDSVAYSGTASPVLPEYRQNESRGTKAGTVKMPNRTDDAKQKVDSASSAELLNQGPLVTFSPSSQSASSFQGQEDRTTMTFRQTTEPAMKKRHSGDDLQKSRKTTPLVNITNAEEENGADEDYEYYYLYDEGQPAESDNLYGDDEEEEEEEEEENQNYNSNQQDTLTFNYSDWKKGYRTDVQRDFYITDIHFSPAHRDTEIRRLSISLPVDDQINTSMLVIYIWLGLLAAMLAITFAVYKYKEQLNVIWWRVTHVCRPSPQQNQADEGLLDHPLV